MAINIKNSEKILLTIFLSLLLTIITYNKYIKPSMDNNMILREEVSILEKDVRRIEEFDSNKESIDITHIQEMDYERINLEIIFKILNLFENEKFKIVDMEFISGESLDENEFIIEDNINFEVYGDLDIVLSFISEIEEKLYNNKINELQLSSFKNGIKASMNLSSYKLNYDFNYTYDFKKENNTDPFGLTKTPMEEEIFKYPYEVNDYKPDKKLETNLNLSKENHKEELNFQFKEIGNEINFKDNISVVSTNNMDIDLYQEMILGEPMLVIDYSIKDKETTHMVDVSFLEKKIGINQNSKIYIRSDLNFDLNIFLDNMEVDSLKTNLENGWVDYKILDSIDYTYLSKLKFQIYDIDRDGKIHVKIK